MPIKWDALIAREIKAKGVTFSTALNKKGDATAPFCCKISSPILCFLERKEKRCRAMNSLESLQQFLGWCSVINISLLAISSVLVIAFRSTITELHSSMFNLEERDLSAAYFHYLAQYKLLTIIFNIVPYLALVIMN